MIKSTEDHLGTHHYETDEDKHVYRCKSTLREFTVKGSDPAPSASPAGGDCELIRIEHALIDFEPSEGFLGDVESAQAAQAAGKALDARQKKALAAADAPELRGTVKKALEERARDRAQRAKARAERDAAGKGPGSN